MWSLLAAVMVIWFFVDDCQRTPDQVAQRIYQWADDPWLPLETTIIYFGLGFLHGQIASARVLGMALMGITLRYVRLAFVLHAVWRPALGVLTQAVPCMLGFVINARLVVHAKH